MRIARVLLILFGNLLIILAGVGILLQAVAFVDPVGAKGSDDGDPFGTPPSRWAIAGEMLISFMVGGVGLLIVRANAKKLAGT